MSSQAISGAGGALSELAAAAALQVVRDTQAGTAAALQALSETTGGSAAPIVSSSVTAPGALEMFA
jgi:hypothetical protein